MLPARVHPRIAGPFLKNQPDGAGGGGARGRRAAKRLGAAHTAYLGGCKRPQSADAQGDDQGAYSAVDAASDGKSIDIHLTDTWLVRKKGDSYL